LKKPIPKLLWPSLLILLLDQITKIWVRSSLNLGEWHRVIGEQFFRLTHVENVGVAFGVQAGGATFLIVFNFVASLVLLYILLKSRRENSTKYPKLLQIALALILGGALGNLIDRLLFGHVTDFLDFDFPDFIMQRWPVFNVADSAVTIGVTLWCIYLLFFSRSKQKIAEQDKKNPSVQI